MSFLNNLRKKKFIMNLLEKRKQLSLMSVEEPKSTIIKQWMKLIIIRILKMRRVRRVK
jgi:hypothetical protein